MITWRHARVAGRHTTHRRPAGHASRGGGRGRSGPRTGQPDADSRAGHARTWTLSSPVLSLSLGPPLGGRTARRAGSMAAPGLAAALAMISSIDRLCRNHMVRPCSHGGPGRDLVHAQALPRAGGGGGVAGGYRRLRTPLAARRAWSAAGFGTAEESMAQGTCVRHPSLSRGTPGLLRVSLSRGIHAPHRPAGLEQ
jgi:hypothetical protein